jgi:hypothetical protein
MLGHLAEAPPMTHFGLFHGLAFHGPFLQEIICLIALR